MFGGRRKFNMWSVLFAAPAIIFVGFYLIYPAVHTTFLSFLDRRMENFVGLDNYVRLFTTEATKLRFATTCCGWWRSPSLPSASGC